MTNIFLVFTASPQFNMSLIVNTAIVEDGESLPVCPEYLCPGS